MYTADMARQKDHSDLDRRIEAAVKSGTGSSAYLRVYIEDSFLRSIRQELEDRGFKNVDVPDIVLKGDVYFEW